MKKMSATIKIFLGILIFSSFLSANDFGYNYLEQEAVTETYPNATIYQNITNIYQNITASIWNGDATSNLDMNGYYITEVGRLLMEGLIESEDIIPAIDDLYSIGNSSNWFSEAFIKKINAENISTIDLFSTNIDSTNIVSVNLDSTNINSEDLTSTKVNATNTSTTELLVNNDDYRMENDGGNMVITLK